MPMAKSRRWSLSRKHRWHPYTEDESEHTESKKRPLKVVGSKEWEDARCPICMDHPHNAVLLICSSHDKGCCPYICNTSYRHSNCLDQYWRAHSGAFRNCKSRECALEIVHSSSVNSQSNGRTGRGSTRAEHSVDHSGLLSFQEKDDVKGLPCPLCRGKVYEWKVVAAAREHLNLKARSCAKEFCAFTGNYEELRAHARREHPFARPSDVDPVRERTWRHLEQQTNVGDVLSSLRSAMPHATVIGDYVLEDDWENDVYGYYASEDDWENENETHYEIEETASMWML